MESGFRNRSSGISWHLRVLETCTRSVTNNKQPENAHGATAHTIKAVPHRSFSLSPNLKQNLHNNLLLCNYGVGGRTCCYTKQPDIRHIAQIVK